MTSLTKVAPLHYHEPVLISFIISSKTLEHEGFHFDDEGNLEKELKAADLEISLRGKVH